MTRVLVPLADGFEEMEGIIIIDVLRRAGVEVVSAALKDGPVQAARGTVHLADTTLEAVQNDDFDMIVLPGGGGGAQNLQRDERIKQILMRMQAKDKFIGAICAAPNVLRNHGILKETDRFTLHPGTVNDGSGGQYVANERIVRTGRITTSIGPGSAFEFALDLVEQLCGKAVRDKTAAPMYLPAVSAE